MAVDLVDLVKGYVTPDVIQRAASYIGESTPATQKALGGVTPTIVAALSSLASTPGGVQQISRLLDSGKYDGSALSSVGSLFGGGVTTQSALGSGKDLLESLFGARTGGVADLIARFAGIGPNAASSLLALAAPLVMHVLGRQRSQGAFSGPGGLGTFLAEQQRSVAGLLPAGLGSLLGWSGLGASVSEVGASAAGAATRVTRDVAETVPAATNWTRWALPLIILGALILGALAWLWQETPTTGVRETAREAARRVAELELPGGAKISVPEGSFNFSLASWLAGTDTTVPRRFIFDNLNFETGGTQLTPESRATVDSLGAILKAYPGVSVALEGHTDSTGDAAANQKLSLDRANAVKGLLVQSGIADTRVATAGLGQERPVAPNDTEEGRARNRRLELVVEKR